MSPGAGLHLPVALRGREPSLRLFAQPFPMAATASIMLPTRTPAVVKSRPTAVTMKSTSSRMQNSYLPHQSIPAQMRNQEKMLASPETNWTRIGGGRIYEPWLIFWPSCMTFSGTI